MSKCNITFLFESGQVFAESWNLRESPLDDAMTRLRRIANSRLKLLASNVKIVLLKAQGHKSERVDIPGTAGRVAWTRVGLNLMRIIGEMMATNVCLRGVSEDLFVNSTLTHEGATAVTNLAKTLFECGAFIILQRGQSQLITDLHITGRTSLSHKKDKPATRRKLISILGEEKALPLWEELKKRKKRPG